VYGDVRLFVSFFIYSISSMFFVCIFLFLQCVIMCMSLLCLFVCLFVCLLCSCFASIRLGRAKCKYTTHLLIHSAVQCSAVPANHKHAEQRFAGWMDGWMDGGCTVQWTYACWPLYTQLYVYSFFFFFFFFFFFYLLFFFFFFFFF